MTNGRRNQKSGPLADHVQNGRTYTSRLTASTNLTLGDWVRDDLPDLLWPVLTLAELGTNDAIRFIRWQESILGDLEGKADDTFLAECLDGRLTGIARLAEQVPGAREAIRDRATEWEILSESTKQILASYPDNPAAWLFENDKRSPREPDIQQLAKAILEVLTDQHREAIVKCLFIWGAVQAGTYRTDKKMIDLLKSYPKDTKTRSQADSIVRASWNANRGYLIHRDSTHFAESIKWAKIFWGVNSMTSRCAREEDIESGPDERTTEQTEKSPTKTQKLKAKDFVQRAMDLTTSYVEAVETTPSRLYDQEREEVHTGLVMRAAREVVTALGATELWCSEYGSHIGRMLVETRILLRWMATQNQEEIYRQYQDYGAGKAKLNSLIFEELPDDVVTAEVAASLEALKAASHNDEIFDYRTVDLSSNFAHGKSLREMAKECALMDLYRHSYQFSSGVVHSEWWSVEMHSMERCRNVLHRGHLIPSLSLSTGNNEELALSWIMTLHTIMLESLEILNTPQDGIERAFGWLHSDAEGSNADGES